MTSSISPPRRPRAEVSPIDPAQRVDQVRLAAAVRPDDAGQPGLDRSSVGWTNDLNPDEAQLGDLHRRSTRAEQCHGGDAISTPPPVENPISLLRPLSPQHAVVHAADVRRGREPPRQPRSGLADQRIDQLAQVLDAARPGEYLAVDHQGRGRADPCWFWPSSRVCRMPLVSSSSARHASICCVAHPAELAELLERTDVVVGARPGLPGSRTARRESRNSAPARRNGPAPPPSAPARRAGNRGRSDAPCRSRCSAP